MTATDIERALCCGPTCGRTRPEHGACLAATHGRAQHERLKAAGFGIYRAEPPDPFPRCGDQVHHIPSGENWVVAWAEGDDIAPAGWPNSIARVRDTRLVGRATDAEHAETVAILTRLRLADDSRATRIRRLYGHTQDPANV